VGRIQDIRPRRGTASAWTSANPTLNDGEIAYESDTGKLKLGDGATAWASLPYLVAQPLRPSYMPKSVAGDWNPLTGLYQSNRDVFGAARAGMGRAKSANATNPYFKLCAFGDSHTEAKMDDTTGASTVGYGTSWPDYLRALLIAAGIPDGGTGWQKPTSATANLDTRFFTGVTGTWTGRTGQTVSSWAVTATAGNTITFELAGGGGVAVDILTSKLNKPFTYTIFNSAATQIATGTTVRDGTSALLVTTIAGLTDAQKLVITALTGTGGTWKLGPCQIRKASGLLLSNFALSNTSANPASPGFGWAADPTAGSATYDWIGSEMLACEPTPDMLACTLTGNDFSIGSRTAAQAAGDMATIWARYTAASKLQIGNWQGAFDQSALQGALMTLMDSVGGAYLDQNFRDGPLATMQARNLYKNSATTHPDEAAHHGTARTVANALLAA
jgi:hypothetical protein